MENEPQLGGLKIPFSEWKRRVLSVRERNLPELSPIQWGGPVPPMCICASGPSLKEHLGKLKRMRRHGARILAVNRAYPFLVRNGIIPDLFAAFDPDEAMIEAVAPKRAETFHLLASQMHPKVFDALKDRKVAVWHAWCAGFGYTPDATGRVETDEDVFKHWGATHIMCMGSHIGMHAMAIATFIGHFDLHLFGYDGCVRSSGTHAFKQAREESPLVEIEYEGRTYRVDQPLSLQAQEFREVARIVKNKVNMTFHGTSLLGAIWQKEAA